MKLSALLILHAFALSAFALPAANEDVAKRFPLLALLTPTEASLPQGCKPKQGELPVKGMRNLAITTDRAAIEFVDETSFESFADDVDALYFAVYQEQDKAKSKLGIFAWALKSEEVAQKFNVDLGEQPRGQAGYFWVSQKYLIYLWRNHEVTDECYRYFEDYVDKQVAQFEAATTSAKSAAQKVPAAVR